MKLISREDAAKRLGCTRQTISNWVSKGIFTPHYVVVNGKRCVFIDGDTLESLFDTLEEVKRSREEANKLLSEVKSMRLEAEQEWNDCVREKIDTFFDFSLVKPILSSFVKRHSRCLNTNESLIVTSVLNGCTFQSLCERFGVTPQRIKQIINSAAKKLAEDAPPIDDDEVEEECPPPSDEEMGVPITDIGLTVRAVGKTSAAFGSGVTLRDISKMDAEELKRKVGLRVFKELSFNLAKRGFSLAE